MQPWRRGGDEFSSTSIRLTLDLTNQWLNIIVTVTSFSYLRIYMKLTFGDTSLPLPSLFTSLVCFFMFARDPRSVSPDLPSMQPVVEHTHSIPLRECSHQFRQASVCSATTLTANEETRGLAVVPPATARPLWPTGLLEHEPCTTQCGWLRES